jgi:hypothetical protein
VGFALWKEAQADNLAAIVNAQRSGLHISGQGPDVQDLPRGGRWGRERECCGPQEQEREGRGATDAHPRPMGPPALFIRPPHAASPPAVPGSEVPTRCSRTFRGYQEVAATTEHNEPYGEATDGCKGAKAGSTAARNRPFCLLLLTSRAGFGGPAVMTVSNVTPDTFSRANVWDCNTRALHLR